LWKEKWKSLIWNYFDYSEQTGNSKSCVVDAQPGSSRVEINVACRVESHVTAELVLFN